MKICGHRLSPGAALFLNVALEIRAEIFHGALERFNSARRQRAKRIAGSAKPGLILEFFDIARLALTFFHSLQDSRGVDGGHSSMACTSRRILARKNARGSSTCRRAGSVIEHDHRAGAESAADFLDFVEIHEDIEMLFGEKVSGCAAREHPAKL